MENTAENDIEYLGCRAGGFFLGIDIRFVGEVFETPMITRLPKSPAFLLGLINVRGSVVPVLDLWNLSPGAPGLRRVVVLKTNEGLVGLLVTHWVDLLRFQKIEQGAPLPPPLEPFRPFFPAAGLPRPQEGLSGDKYYLARVEELVGHAAAL